MTSTREAGWSWTRGKLLKLFGFRVLQDGKDVPVTTCVVEFGDAPGHLVLHFRHQLSFAASAASVVTVTYAMPTRSAVSGDPASPRAPGISREFTWKYMLQTASSWKGSLGKIVLSVPPGFATEPRCPVALRRNGKGPAPVHGGRLEADGGAEPRARLEGHRRGLPGVLAKNDGAPVIREIFPATVPRSSSVPPLSSRNGRRLSAHGHLARGAVRRGAAFRRAARNGVGRADREERHRRVRQVLAGQGRGPARRLPTAFNDPR